MTDQSRAWLLEPLGVARCAVAEHEIVQYLNTTDAYAILFGLPHCGSAILWQQQLVPLLNLSALTAVPEAVRGLALLAYQDASGEPLRYVALALQVPPQRITVSDASACELPTEYGDFWPLLARSCFFHLDQPTPIIDIKRLCSVDFRDFAVRRFANLPVAPISVASCHPQSEPSDISASKTVSDPDMNPDPINSLPKSQESGNSGDDEDDLDDLDDFDENGLEDFDNDEDDLDDLDDDELDDDLDDLDDFDENGLEDFDNDEDDLDDLDDDEFDGKDSDDLDDFADLDEALDDTDNELPWDADENKYKNTDRSEDKTAYAL